MPSLGPLLKVSKVYNQHVSWHLGLIGSLWSFLKLTRFLAAEKHRAAGFFSRAEIFQPPDPFAKGLSD